MSTNNNILSFNDFIDELENASRPAGNLSIIEFANDIIFNKDPDFKLYPTQQAILKSFYNEPLSTEEKLILNGWVDEGRSTWVDARKYISLVVEAGRRGSKCGVRKEWLTYTDKGLYYIEEIAKENAINTSYTGWNPLKNKMSAIQEQGKNQEITDIYVENKVRTKRITTREGYAFEATPEHKIKVLEPNGLINWKEFQYINENDFIVINKNNNYNVENYYKIDHTKYLQRVNKLRPYTNPKYVDETIGYLLGVMCGDGTWDASTINITSHIEDAPILIKRFKEYFGEQAVFFQKHTNKNCGSLRIGNGNLKTCLDSIGYQKANNGEKQVPWVIRRSPKTVIASFLSGLFDTDGTVVKNGRTIEFCAKDYTLIREVQQLLLIFGIISNIKQYYNAKFKTHHWKLRLNGLESRQIFKKQIGFHLPRKQRKIDNDLNLKNNSNEGGYLSSIPYQQDILYTYKQSLDIPNDNFIIKENSQGEVGTTFKGSIKSNKSYRTDFRNIAGNCCKKNNKENITYPKLIKLLNWAKEQFILPNMITHYEYISSNNFFFSKVEKYEESENDVGDINVNTSHKYIANGCISHNCNASSALIPTTKGDITLGELHTRLQNKEHIGIYTYDFRENITKSYITYNIKTEFNAIEPTYKITTQTGKVEIVNKNHPFLTLLKNDKYPRWVELKDLKVGQYIATSSELPIYGELNLEEKYLEVLALCITNFDHYNHIIPSKYKRVLEEYFNIEKPTKLTIEKKKQLTQQLNNYVLEFRKELQPNFITSFNKESTLTFFKYLFKYNTTDEILNHQDSLVAHKLNVVLQLHKYKEEIHKQLLKIGVTAQFISSTNQELEGIVINNTNSIDKLVSLFGWNIYKGEEFLKTNFTDRLSKIGGVSYGTDRFNSELCVIEDQYPHTNLKDYPVLNRAYRDLEIGKKEVIKNIALLEDDSKLYDAVSNNINWEKIESIEYYNTEQTIALEVEGTHVIGSYIISHNSTMASIIVLKEFYDLINSDNPQKQYGMLDGSPITILVMAQSQAQVKETVFAAIKGYAENSKYFKNKKNNGEIEILSEEIRCAHKNVAIYAKHTNSKSLVGYNLKCMVLDEVARFESIGEEGKNKAFEIWENVAAGGAGFGEHFKKVAISSAWEPGDPIEIFYQRAFKDSNTLAFKLTTFQLNLSLKKGITQSIVSDYRNDYVKARREYEGIRFAKFNTFIDINKLNQACRSVSIIDATPCQIDTQTTGGMQYYAGLTITRISPNQPNDPPAFIHIDPALKKDSAALAIASPIKEDGKWKIQIDSILKWQPHTDDKGYKRIVSFVDIEEKLFEILKVRKINKVTLDQWNSQSIIQKLQSKGYDAQQVSVSRDMQFTYYTLFRDLLTHDCIILPRDSGWTNEAVIELSELVLKANKQVIHPTAGKDIADAIVNAVYQCNQYMIRTGISTNILLNTNIVPSQGLASLSKVSISSNHKTSLKVGNAIDKLYSRNNKPRI